MVSYIMNITLLKAIILVRVTYIRYPSIFLNERSMSNQISVQNLVALDPWNLKDVGLKIIAVCDILSKRINHYLFPTIVLMVVTIP